MGTRGLRLSGLAQEQIVGRCMRKGIFGFLRLQGISWLAEQLLPSQIGLCSTEKVNESVCPSVKLTNKSKRNKTLSAAPNSIQYWPRTYQHSFCFTMFIWIQASTDNECRKWRHYCHRVQRSRPATGFASSLLSNGYFFKSSQCRD